MYVVNNSCALHCVAHGRRDLLVFLIACLFEDMVTRIELISMTSVII